MSELKSDDLLLVNRAGVDYKITMQDLADYLQVEPVPEPPAELPWEKYIGVKPVYHITNISSPVKFLNAEGVWLASGEAYTGGGDLPDGLGDYYIMGSLVKFQSYSGEWDFGPDTDTTGLVDCTEMFKGSRKFNGAFGGNWDMSKVTTMESMFEDCFAMDRPEIGTWDVHNVTNFKMFLGNNYNFNQDLSNWCVPNFTREPQFFWGEALIGVNRPGWGTCPNGECGTVIPNDYDWKSTVKVHITDVVDNSVAPPKSGEFCFSWSSTGHTPYNHFREDGSYANTKYSFGKVGKEFYCSWDDKEGRMVNLGRHHILSWNFGPDTDTTGLTNLDGLLENAKYWKGNFGGTWDLSKVTSMKKTFKDVGIDIGNGGKYSWPLGHPIEGIEGFDVSKVEDFEECFRNTNHDIDVSKWDTSSAKNMNNMFWQATDNNHRPGPKEPLRGWCVKHISKEPPGWDWMYESDKPAWSYCPAEGNNPPDLTESTIYECYFMNTPVGSWGTGGLGVLTIKDANGNVYTQKNFEPSDSFGDPERIFTGETWNKGDADAWKVDVLTATAPPILEWIPRATLIGNKLEFAYFADGSEFEVVVNGVSQGEFEFNKNNVELLEFTIPDGKFKSLEIKNKKQGVGMDGELWYKMAISNIYIDDHNVQTPRQDGQVHLFFDKEAQDDIAELVASPTFKGGSQVMGADHGDHRFDIMTADAKNLTVVLNHSDNYNTWRKPSDFWFPKD